MVVRPYCDVTDQQVASALAGAAKDAWRDQGIDMEANGEPLYLFDSAFAGDELGVRPGWPNYAVLHSTAAGYRVKLIEFGPVGDVNYVVTGLMARSGIA